MLAALFVVIFRQRRPRRAVPLPHMSTIPSKMDRLESLHSQYLANSKLGEQYVAKYCRVLIPVLRRGH